MSMKGHIRERSPGHWAIILDVRDPETGKRRRKWHSFKGTKREAQIESSRLISEISGGAYIEPAKITVGQFLERWLEHIKPQVSPRTHERYGEIVKKNIHPPLGSMILTKLRPMQISDAYAKALSGGRRDGRGGLSPSTVRYLHVILKAAGGQAVRWQMLARNPVDAVDPPKPERSAMSIYDLAQTADLIEATRGTRMAITVILAVLCGLRRGEIAALRWRNINLGAGQIAVTESAEQTRAGVRYKQPKSGRGRTVALSTRVVNGLRSHRVQQAQELLMLGIPLTTLLSLRRPMVAPCSREPLPTNGICCSRTTRRCRASASTIYGTLMRPICYRRASIPKSPASASDTPRSGSQWTSIRTLCRECRKMPPPALTAIWRT
jgi:integrase